ncbi:hypothetical protein JOM56_015301 [Amanita muscaria]
MSVLDGRHCSTGKCISQLDDGSVRPGRSRWPKPKRNDCDDRLGLSPRWHSQQRNKRRVSVLDDRISQQRSKGRVSVLDCHSCEYTRNEFACLISVLVPTLMLELLRVVVFSSPTRLTDTKPIITLSTGGGLNFILYRDVPNRDNTPSPTNVEHEERAEMAEVEEDIEMGEIDNDTEMGEAGEENDDDEDVEMGEPDDDVEMGEPDDDIEMGDGQREH